MNSSFTAAIKSLMMPDQVTVLAVTGQAGAGKTNHVATEIVRIAAANDFPTASLPLDAFFILSSRDRKEWLEAGKTLGSDEYNRRCDQMNWWDFDKAAQALSDLKSGKPLRLTDIYNRSDSGELTGTLDLEPVGSGMLVLFEGVATVHFSQTDHVLYVHAPSATRFQRLHGRDQGRRLDTAAAEERFRLTQAFEQRYFPPRWDEIDTFVDNTNGSGLIIIESLNPQVALL